MQTHRFLSSIEQASNVVGTTWPLYSFVTSNPLSGYEQNHFTAATQTAANLLGVQTYPAAQQYKDAWKSGQIDDLELRNQLATAGFNESIETYLNQLETVKQTTVINPNHKLDRILAKWLAAFLDEGLAEWEMPNKENGFYAAWRSLAIYDNELGIKKISDIPETSDIALSIVLKDLPEAAIQNVFAYHLAAMPGWTGYIKHRVQNNTLWQQSYNMDLKEYLAARLWVAHTIEAVIMPGMQAMKDTIKLQQLQHIFLTSWEKSWQHWLGNKLATQDIAAATTLPDAQMAFCIDTRSELIRRHVEAAGNYETFGYAGFFGIAMDYTGMDDGLSRKSCPPIVTTAYQITETEIPAKNDALQSYKKQVAQSQFANYFLTRMKNMLPSAFGYVEGSGVLYGISLLRRTLFPTATYKPQEMHAQSYEHSCTPAMNHAQPETAATRSIPLDDKVSIVKGAFDLTGWQHFAPLVLFVGHGTHTANNPFGSSLDCGACAASPGRHNARMLATLANDPAVRKALSKNYGMTVPDTTVFVGAEHNTTTDAIILFDNTVPASHHVALAQLKANLATAQQTATQERLHLATKSIQAAHKKTTNWAETRPEWGLAKNAGFIVGPRSLTKHSNLEGSCFLHSYNWQLDTDGAALSGIMQGPMVVTQWINNHYYFATVDNNGLGGGSKITHNITGRYGVVQGNGGDLKTGLPLQSVNETDAALYHKPLRLSVLIQAPQQRIQHILDSNANLKALVDNQWIHLMAMDPTTNNKVYTF